MEVGFTGTQRGMTNSQKEELVKFLQDNKVTKLHHGDCVGADKEAHDIAVSLGIETEVHPPDKDDKRAFCKGDIIHEPKPYLERNHDIVDDSELLVACPFQSKEIVRSGTWATVRYARKSGSPIIFSPNPTDEELGLD